MKINNLVNGALLIRFKRGNAFHTHRPKCQTQNQNLKGENLPIKYIKHNYSAIQLYFIYVNKVWNNEESLVVIEKHWTEMPIL